MPVVDQRVPGSTFPPPHDERMVSIGVIISLQLCNHCFVSRYALGAFTHVARWRLQ
jgi:hypothetical protein